MEKKLYKNFSYNSNNNNEKFNSFNYIDSYGINKIKKYLLPSINNNSLFKNVIFNKKERIKKNYK